MADTTPQNEDDLITVPFAEALLIASFPGADLKKGTAIGRRVSFNLEFGEFQLTVTLPAESNIRADTTFIFRRRVHNKVVHQVNRKIDRYDAPELQFRVKQARGYVLGIFVALKSVLDAPPPDLADIMGD